jgi:hypothetical protein
MNRAQMRDAIERLTRQRDEMSENGALAMAMLDAAHGEYIDLLNTVRDILGDEGLCSCCKVDVLWHVLEHSASQPCPDCDERTTHEVTTSLRSRWRRVQAHPR